MPFVSDLPDMHRPSSPPSCSWPASKVTSSSALSSGVTYLIPNLQDLLAVLPTSPAGRDAAELAEAVGEATSLDDVDAALDRVIARWATA